MHRIPRDRELAFESQGVSPIDAVATVGGDDLREDGLPFRPDVGAEMISTFFLAN